MVEKVNGKDVEVEVIGKDKVQEVLDGIRKGKIFTALFVKKDGSERKMNCRKEVKKDQVGGELKYDPAAHKLVSVYDMKAGGYRMVNVKTVTEIRANKKRYIVE